MYNLFYLNLGGFIMSNKIFSFSKPISNDRMISEMQFIIGKQRTRQDIEQYFSRLGVKPNLTERDWENMIAFQMSCSSMESLPKIDPELLKEFDDLFQVKK